MGRVVNITKFGAFVNILPGRDGLVHISKLGRGKRINSVEDVLAARSGDRGRRRGDRREGQGQPDPGRPTDPQVPSGDGESATAPAVERRREHRARSARRTRRRRRCRSASTTPSTPRSPASSVTSVPAAKPVATAATVAATGDRGRPWRRRSRTPTAVVAAIAERSRITTARQRPDRGHRTRAGALSVAAGVWVGVGARDEPAESAASATSSSTCCSRAPRAIGAGHLRAIDRDGGDINAFTSKEYTAYYCRLPARHLALGTRAARRRADVARRCATATSRPSAGDPRRARDGRRQPRRRRAPRLRRRSCSPTIRSAATRPASATPSRRSRRTTCGRSSVIGAYRAARMVVSLAGPLDHDEMLAVVESAFAAIGDGASVPAALARRRSPRRTDRFDDDTEQVHIVVGGRALAPDRRRARGARRRQPRPRWRSVEPAVRGDPRAARARLLRVLGRRRYADAGRSSIYAGTSPAPPTR